MDLTVVICMYNAERYIEGTLKAILSQTRQDFRLLIIDDHSIDGSVEIVKKFFDKNPREYNLVEQTENMGIAWERNFALNYSETKYLVFIDADDIPLPTLLEKEYNLISSDQELMAVSSWSQFIDINCNPIKGGLFIGEVDKDSFFEKAKSAKLIFLPIQTMFEREVAISVGGFCCDGFPQGKPRYQDYCEDLDLWTRMSDLYKDRRAIVTIPEVLYKYRKADSLSSSHFNMIIKMRYIKKNLILRRRELKQLSFVDFYSSLGEEELKTLKRGANAADALRNGAFYFHKRKIVKGLWCFLKSFYYQPLYVFDKLKHNIIMFKKTCGGGYSEAINLCLSIAEKECEEPFGPLQSEAYETRIIPKKIHFCWLSGDPFPPEISSYIESWRKVLPDWEIILWDCNRFDINSVRWCKQAFEKKKYAFAADYIRFYALYHEGGVYLDSDVRMIKSFNDLLTNKSFFGYESCSCPEAAIIGSIPGMPWLKDCLDFYETHEFIAEDGSLRMCPVPRLIRKVIENRYNIKVLENNSIQEYQDGRIYPYYYFSPKSHYFPKIDIREETYCIHNFAASWGRKPAHLKKKKKFRIKIKWGVWGHRILLLIFGKRLHDNLFYHIQHWPYK